MKSIELGLVIATALCCSLSTVVPVPALADKSPFDVEPTPQAPAAARPKLNTFKEYAIRASEETANKDYRNSIEDYSESIRLNPKYGIAYGNRGAAKWDIGDYEGALADAKKGLDLVPGNEIMLSLKKNSEEAIRNRAAQRQQAVEALQQLQTLNRVRSQFGVDMSSPAYQIMQQAQQVQMLERAQRARSTPANIPVPFGTPEIR